jgi:hypothetical protein
MAFDPLSDPNKKAAEIDALLKKADQEKLDAAARKDAEGETLDKLLACVDAMNRKMCDWEEKEKARDDAAAAASEKSDPKPLAADSTEEEKMEPKMDSTGVFRDAYGDACWRADSHKSREQWQNDASLAQSTADRIYQVGGSKAPQICEGESIRAYRIRLLTPMRHTSAAYAKVDSAEFKKLPAAMFAIAERQVYCDADKSARNPIDGAPDGSLREYFQVDDAGRRIRCWAGTRSFIHDFAGTRQYLTKINTGRTRTID